jgi:rhodanese-related sulfurtransferase
MVRSILALVLFMGAQIGTSQAQPALDATFDAPDAQRSEVSTTELRRILAAGDALVLDARPYPEYAISHIPGARNVAPKPGLPASEYVSDVREIERLTKGRRDQALVLYCNGPFCGKSRRLATELGAGGFTQVRRYTLGAPGWRAMGGEMQTEPSALGYIASDPTSVWVDARSAESARRNPVRGARSIPAAELRPGKDQGVMKTAKDDGRLPTEDHNTRLVVFADDPAEASAVAHALAREAFHNVSFTLAKPEAVRAALLKRRSRSDGGR